MGLRVLLRSNARDERAMSHVLCCCSFTVSVWLRCSVFRPIMTPSSVWRHRSLIFLSNSVPHSIENVCRLSCPVSCCGDLCAHLSLHRVFDSFVYTMVKHEERSDDTEVLFATLFISLVPGVSTREDTL